MLKVGDWVREDFGDMNLDIELVLIITHGIFSDGLEGLRGQFDSLMVLETDYNYNRLFECH